MLEKEWMKGFRRGGGYDLRQMDAQGQGWALAGVCSSDAGSSISSKTTPMSSQQQMLLAKPNFTGWDVLRG